MTCSRADLPSGPENLVCRAAAAFLAAAKINDGVKIHLEKNIPLAAGLGGGSGNAAVTLLALNELFAAGLGADQLHTLAAGLGSDVPFFSGREPALATGRGEQIAALPPFTALRGTHALLIHPGFGIATAWAYQQLANYPAALNGQRGRGEKLIKLLQGDADMAGAAFYNSLEARP